MEKNFSKLVNLIWSECIENLNGILAESEREKFSNNDYYYLLMIQSMKNPILSDIATKLNMTKPAITCMIHKLENLGLVKKYRSENDKRMFHVCLTEKGEQILDGDRTVYRRVVSMISSICKDERELEIVTRIVEDVVNELENNAEKTRDE